VGMGTLGTEDKMEPSGKFDIGSRLMNSYTLGMITFTSYTLVQNSKLFELGLDVLRLFTLNL